MSEPEGSILVIGNLRQTLTVVRALAREGRRLIVGVGDETAYAEYSRYTDEVWCHPDVVSSRAEFVAALQALLSSRPDIKCLFPVGEDEMLALGEVYARLSGQIKILMPAPATVQTCVHKPTMLRIVDELDIPQAPHALVSSCEQLLQAAARIGYPVIAKPTDSSVSLWGRKALIFEDPAAARSRFSSWPVEAQQLIVQRHAGGPRHNVYFFAVDGEWVRASEVKILRTDRPDDTGLAVSGVTVAINPELEAYCRRLVKRLNYTGMGCIQFLFDEEHQRVSFLELNPRLGANFAIVYHAGFNLPKMALDLADGRFDANACEHQAPCRVGLHYAWTQGELLALKNAIVNECPGPRTTLGRLLLIARTCFGSSVHITWFWKDPVPTILLYFDLLPSPLRWMLPGRKR